MTRFPTTKFLLAICFSLLLMRGAKCQTVNIPEDSPRLTTLVKVIRSAEPAIASLFMPTDQGQLVSGGGTIIHPSGFILTNNHVLPGNQGLALIGPELPGNQKPEQFQVVGRLPEKDLAIVKLKSSGLFPAIPLGRSHDVLNGESIVVAGNPGGRGLVFTSGIVSSRSVLSGGPNALVMTNYKNSRRDTYIQFDAASNGGNSGGGLINMEGKLIGVVWGGIRQEQNIGFAIPVDRFHELVEEIVEPELRNRREIGIELQPEGISAVVASVLENSAAAEAGLQPGDEILAVNGETIRHRVDWILTLSQLLPSERKFSVTVKRGEESKDLFLTPRERAPIAAVAVNESDLEPGLSYRFYHGQYSLLPNFAELTPVREATVSVVNLLEIRRDRQDEFAVQLKGLLRVPDDGLYRLIVQSDDGSRMWLNGKLVIDNDGNHQPQARGRVLYLAKGFHEIEIGYFEGNGAEDLQFQFEREGTGTLGSVPAEMLWHLKVATPNAGS